MILNFLQVSKTMEPQEAEVVPIIYFLDKYDRWKLKSQKERWLHIFMFTNMQKHFKPKILSCNGMQNQTQHKERGDCKECRRYRQPTEISFKFIQTSNIKLLCLI